MTEDQGQFAGGMNPETDGRRASSALKITIIVVAILLFLGTCFGGCVWGLFYFIDAGSGMALKPQIEGTPAIETYIGQVDEIGMDWGQTAQQAQSGNDDRLAFSVSGDKGSGLLLVEQGPAGLANAAWAILEFDGKSYVVFGEPPTDLGAEKLPEPEGNDDEKTDQGESTVEDTDGDGKDPKP